MSILLKNAARVTIPEEHIHEILSMYVHYNTNGDSVKNYKYKDGIAYLPLNIDKLHYVSSLLNVPIIDDRSKGEPLQVPFKLASNFSFRPHQVAPAAQLVEHCRTHNYGILCAGCGNGKTVVMTYVAGVLNGKILILVDMSMLQSQWAEAFKMVWGRDVQVLSKDTTSFGDVCIATFQLLHANIDMAKRIRKMFRILLIDEYHSSGSDTRKEILWLMNNEYRIGCTATPWRKGYSDEVLTDFVSSISVTMEDKNALKADVNFIATGTKFYSNNPDMWGKTTSALSKDVKRNALIAKMVCELYNEGRKIVVVGITVQSLKDISAMIYKILPECKLRVYIGSTTLIQDQELRRDLDDGTIRVVLTVKKLDRGVDLPSLDCLILARPANNEAFVTQIAGRIVRPVEGKATPVIYDFVDSSELAVRFATNRRRWYKKLGYVIQKDIDK